MIECDRCGEISTSPTLMVIEYTNTVDGDINRTQDYELCQACTSQIQIDIMDLIYSRTSVA